MYDAINKGISLARGEIIGLLNSDDLYAPSAFVAVARAFYEFPEALAVVGSAITIDEQGKLLVHAMPRPTIMPQELWQRVTIGTPVTNAWFFKREVFKKIGLFDAKYLYVADRDFLMRAVLMGVSPLPLEQTLYCYRSHPGSATVNSVDSRNPERGAQRMKKIWEDIDVYEKYLRKSDLPKEMRFYTLSAHDLHCFKLVLTTFYFRHWDQTLRAARLGWRFNALWPFEFSKYTLKRIWKEISFNV
jgi:GT2 family glycosyltransferase